MRRVRLQEGEPNKLSSSIKPPLHTMNKINNTVEKNKQRQVSSKKESKKVTIKDSLGFSSRSAHQRADHHDTKSEAFSILQQKPYATTENSRSTLAMKSLQSIMDSYQGKWFSEMNDYIHQIQSSTPSQISSRSIRPGFSKQTKFHLHTDPQKLEVDNSGAPSWDWISQIQPRISRVAKNNETKRPPKLSSHKDYMNFKQNMANNSHEVPFHPMKHQDTFSRKIQEAGGMKVLYMNGPSSTPAQVITRSFSNNLTPVPPSKFDPLNDPHLKPAVRHLIKLMNNMTAQMKFTSYSTLPDYPERNIHFKEWIEKHGRELIHDYNTFMNSPKPKKFMPAHRPRL